MLCTKNFLIVRTYLINYIYIYYIEFEKWVQETKRPKEKKCFVLLMNLNRQKLIVDKIAIRIDMYYLCIDV